MSKIEQCEKFLESKGFAKEDGEFRYSDWNKFIFCRVNIYDLYAEVHTNVHYGHGDSRMFRHDFELDISFLSYKIDNIINNRFK